MSCNIYLFIYYLHHQTKALVESRHSGVLIGNVASGGVRVWHVVRNQHLTVFIVSRPPVWDQAHSRFAIAKPLAEVTKLGMSVTAPMGIMGGNVQEKILAYTKTKVKPELQSMHFYLQCPGDNNYQNLQMMSVKKHDFPDGIESKNCSTRCLTLVMFLPTWRIDSVSSVNEKSNGNTDSGPTCFLPMIPVKIPAWRRR